MAHVLGAFLGYRYYRKFHDAGTESSLISILPAFTDSYLWYLLAPSDIPFIVSYIFQRIDKNLTCLTIDQTSLATLTPQNVKSKVNIDYV